MCHCGQLEFMALERHQPSFPVSLVSRSRDAHNHAAKSTGAPELSENFGKARKGFGYGSKRAVFLQELFEEAFGLFAALQSDGPSR